MMTEFGHRVGGIRPGKDGPGCQNTQDKNWVVYLLCVSTARRLIQGSPCTYIIEGMDTNAIAWSDTCGMEAGRQFANENQGLVPTD